MNLRQFLLLASAVIMIIANLFYQALTKLLLGFTPNEYGKYYEAFVVISPEEFTFIVWAPIFIGMLVFAVYQALPQQKNSPLHDRLLLPILSANFFNTIVLYLDYGWNIVALVGMLIALCTAFVMVQKNKERSVRFFCTIEFPVSVFFGWSTVALILGTSQSLVFFGWDAWGISEAAWTAIFIGIISILGTLLYKRFRSLVYTGVLLWAFFGIFAATYGVYTYLPLVIVLGALLLVLTPVVVKSPASA
jgi:hypothetical protein